MSLFGGRRGDADVPGEATVRPVATSAPVRPPVPPEQRRNAPPPPQREGNEMANIGKSISIKGDLTGNEDMVIEGKVEGKVDLPNNQLTIGANGSISAEVHAKSVVVVGRVAGNINGSERVEIQATGVVDGDVRAPRLVVAEGAVLNGAIEMTKKEGSAAGARPPAPTPQREPQKAAG